MQIDRHPANPFNGFVRSRRTTAIGACLAVAVIAAVTIAVFLPANAGAAQAKPQHAAACQHSYTTETTSPGGGQCATTVTTCNAPTTTTTTIATTTTAAPNTPPASAPTTTTTGVETTTTAPHRSVAPLAPTTTSPPAPPVGINVPTPTAAPPTPPTLPTPSPVGGGLLPATTTTLPAPIVAGITVKLPPGAAAELTTPGTLAQTGFDWILPAIFGACCLVAGAMLVLRRRGAWSA